MYIYLQVLNNHITIIKNHNSLNQANLFLGIDRIKLKGSRDLIMIYLIFNTPSNAIDHLDTVNICIFPCQLVNITQIRSITADGVRKGIASQGVLSKFAISSLFQY